VDESFIERWYRNVVVGSCLLESVALRRIGSLAGDTVKKRKTGRVPWDKVPSSEVIEPSLVMDGDMSSTRGDRFGGETQQAQRAGDCWGCRKLR
jgi:hypothetical protein